MKNILTAFSYNRENVAGWIEDHAYPTMKAIARLYLFPDTAVKDLWRNDVWETFHSMRTLRPSYKLPSAKFIYKNSWIPNADFASTAIKMALEADYMRTPRPQYLIAEYQELASKYFWWISEKLSNVPAVSEGAVNNKLQELGL